MMKRNDPCLCGSGKKYKKCCGSKQQNSTEKVYFEEIEQILHTFYNRYPEKKDIHEYYELVQQWLSKLNTHLQSELIETVALDEYFFHQRNDIWKKYLKKTLKKLIRPTTIKVLKSWSQGPKMFIGQVDSIEEQYFKATCKITNETYLIRRESNKEVSEGMQVFAFLLPFTSEDYLTASTLIFFPQDYKNAFETFAQKYDEKSFQSVDDYLRQSHFDFWMQIVESDNNKDKEEITSFNEEVIDQTKQFLLDRNLENQRLIDLIEGFLIEQQPKARKASVIAAGAIRFGQEIGLFENSLTNKEIAESFSVSTSSLNKYYQELLNYASITV